MTGSGNSGSPLSTASAALLIAATLCAIPFLLPVHELPLPSFQPEWLAVALGTAAVTLVIWGHAGRAAALPGVPRLAACLLAFAAYILAQALLHPPAYWSIPVLGALYALFAAMVVWLGAWLTRTFGSERVVLLLARCMVIGAVLTAVAAFVQYGGRPRWLEALVAGLASQRAYGNVAQANLFANYIALGEASLIYLWAAGCIRTPAAMAAALMLAGAGALSGTRATLLFAVWFAVLGAGCGIRGTSPRSLRFAIASAAMALSIFAASVAVSSIDARANGVAPASTMSRTLDGTALASEPRWQAWQLAVGIFLQSPLVGSGWGTFPGAAFEAGVSPQMTRIGDVWTSSHNIMLSLLSETGLIGALIVLVGLGAWGRSAVQTWRAGACPGMVWIIAIAGVEFLHSLVEFPLWSAHFLALTALVMGTGSATAASPAPRRLLAALAAGGGIMTVALAMALRDHVRLDSSRITGTSTTLAAPATVQRDAETMNDLARGIFAPVAERHILNGLPPGQPPTRETLAMSERLMSYWPSNETAVRRAILLVLDGQRAEGEELLRKSLRSFPSRCEMTRSLLGRARASDPIAIDALLAAATRDIGAPCR